jgi:HEAT repeat protein
MSFIGWFATDQEKRLAREEAAYAAKRHGAEAKDVLLMKAQKTPSSERRRIYKLALVELRKLDR